MLTMQTQTPEIAVSREEMKDDLISSLDKFQRIGIRPAVTDYLKKTVERLDQCETQDEFDFYRERIAQGFDLMNSLARQYDIVKSELRTLLDQAKKAREEFDEQVANGVRTFQPKQAFAGINEKIAEKISELQALSRSIQVDPDPELLNKFKKVFTARDEDFEKNKSAIEKAYQTASDSLSNLAPVPLLKAESLESELHDVMHQIKKDWQEYKENVLSQLKEPAATTLKEPAPIEQFKHEQHEIKERMKLRLQEFQSKSNEFKLNEDELVERVLAADSETQLTSAFSQLESDVKKIPAPKQLTPSSYKELKAILTYAENEWLVEQQNPQPNLEKLKKEIEQKIDALPDPKLDKEKLKQEFAPVVLAKSQQDQRQAAENVKQSLKEMPRPKYQELCRDSNKQLNNFCQTARPKISLSSENKRVFLESAKQVAIAMSLPEVPNIYKIITWSPWAASVGHGAYKSAAKGSIFQRAKNFVLDNMKKVIAGGVLATLAAAALTTLAIVAPPIALAVVGTALTVLTGVYVVSTAYTAAKFAKTEAQQRKELTNRMTGRINEQEQDENALYKETMGKEYVAPPEKTLFQKIKSAFTSPKPEKEIEIKRAPEEKHILDKLELLKKDLEIKDVFVKSYEESLESKINLRVPGTVYKEKELKHFENDIANCEVSLAEAKVEHAKVQLQIAEEEKKRGISDNVTQAQNKLQIEQAYLNHKQDDREELKQITKPKQTVKVSDIALDIVPEAKTQTQTVANKHWVVAKRQPVPEKTATQKSEAANDNEFKSEVKSSSRLSR
jgi:hypothetical protein